MCACVETPTLSQVLQAISLHGFHDQEIGNANEAPGLWAAIIRFSDDDRAKGLTNPDDDTTIDVAGLQGAILTCNGQGFYDCEAFDSRQMLELSWERLESDLSIPDDESEV